ncbi:MULTISPECIES: histidinol-phosphate transaminase [Brenneria]|uniref:Histidinol-phosphate aminotransferase n=1 Tax=Brenneria nigrifluens DSM 30175 = ATCC 13028 TaxID=1121120 RepID=A0A2U1URK2_9GAMM|nr:MULTISPECIES: histidinol-phosphate transaminase [Brenneria]EHD23153.1 Histidinol-phosphate aminotransferase [Brenneria sp. EniD312]PWC24244.1 histidinol-phosphate transaminase [Brenneria nigrifluens DSM 30175 = ATCC 13028]QCR06035.1 histidinol-phosphate transaminase [Brenneria nigrifluens DSM 30175 = ATCC 13028]
MSSIKHRPCLDTLRGFHPPSAAGQPDGRLTNLALNENSLGYSPRVAQALAASAARGEASRYPDSFCSALRHKLAHRHALEAERFLFGNGIFEILSLIGSVFVGENDEVVIPEPSFGWYAVASRVSGGRIVAIPLREYAIDLDAVAAAIGPRTRLVWLCNPHNPMGTIVADGGLRAFLERVPPDVAVVLDEAYGEYAASEDFPDGIALTRRYPNLIVLRTFSKAYGLAGLRIGYAIADAATIALLHKVKTPPNVNHLAQIAAVAALDDEAFLARSVAAVRQGLSDYYACCDALGLGYIPSFANFLMINLDRDGDETAQQFLDAGIVLRSGRESGLPQWIRVTIGNDEENLRVFAVLRRLAADHRL